MRVIGGAWRGRKLRFPATPGLRPTPGRVRETLFNWLGQDLTGKSCLDLFAGSGALGFEAASRGARPVLMVEADPGACAALRRSVAELGAGGVEVRCADVFRAGLEEGLRFDVVFIDPPYAAGLHARALELAGRHLHLGGVVYYESAQALDLAALDPATFDPAGWRAVREKRAGQVHYYLLRRPGHAESDLPGDL